MSSIGLTLQSTSTIKHYFPKFQEGIWVVTEHCQRGKLWLFQGQEVANSGYKEGKSKSIADSVPIMINSTFANFAVAAEEMFSMAATS